MQGTVLEGRRGNRLAFFKSKSQFHIRQVPKRGILQGAVNKAKVASSMRIVDPSIRSLEIETSSRVSQQRFHCAQHSGSEGQLTVGIDPRSENLKLRILREGAKNPIEKPARRSGVASIIYDVPA